MTTEIQIFALNVKDRNTQNGSTELAFFSCCARGFTLEGCLLSLRPDGRLLVFPPRISGDNARNSIWIDEAALREAITQAALHSYRKEGGQHAPMRQTTAERAREQASVPLQRVS